jgi:hypothetical protein
MLFEYLNQFFSEKWKGVCEVCLLWRIKRELRGQQDKGVGVMKDKELKLEETEASLTLGGAIKYP